MTKKCNRLRGERPKAFWGALVGGAMNLIGSAISSKSQARAIRRQIEAQKEAAQTQLELANNSNLASTLNSYAAATRSYNDEDYYNLKYRLGGNKRLGSNRIYITDGGNATKIGNDTYLLRGGSHEQTNETGQTGIGINVGGNEIEAEGGEVAQKKNGALRIFSAQPILDGISPAQAVMNGVNKDKVFNAQQRFKKINHLSDGGNTYKKGGRCKLRNGGYYGANYPSPLSLLRMVVYKDLGNGRYLRLSKNKYKLGGGLTSKDRGSSKHPYPSVSSKDFAGGGRSYPIPTKADAVDALRLAGLHGRSDVRSKVYSKYPSLRPKAAFGDWVRTNRDDNALASLLYESGLFDRESWNTMLRDIHTFTGMGGNPYNTDDNIDAVMAPAFNVPNQAQIIRNVQQANKLMQASKASQAAQRTAYAAKEAKDFYRGLGINIPVGRNQIYNPTFRSSEIAAKIKDSNDALRIYLHNTHLPKGIRLTPVNQGDISRSAARIINPREADIVKMGIPISQSAKNMTNGANPFLYAPRNSNKILEGLSRVISNAKQGAKSAGQKVGNKFKGIPGQKLSDAYYGLTPMQRAKLKGLTLAATLSIPAGYFVESQNGRNKKVAPTKKDAHGKPISKYIARPQEPVKQQTRQIPANVVRKAPTQQPSRVQVKKTVPTQVKKTIPQYKGNVTKGNYQLHDGETKTINGIKYTRRGNAIINHKTNVAYIYDKNGNYTGQADYSKVGNFNQAFDAARAAGRSQFIYRAGKYNNYSTNKETDVRKERLNRIIGAKRIAKSLGGYSRPVKGMRAKFAIGGKEDEGYSMTGELSPVITTARYRTPSFTTVDTNARAIPNFSTIKVPTYVPSSTVPYIGQDYNRSRTIFTGGDYLGLGIDALSALGTGLITSNAYKNLDFNYNLPNFVEESPVALNTTYHNEAQKSNVERNRLNSRNNILRNTMSSSTAVGRMQGVDTNALYQLNQLADEKTNKETELMNQNLLNEQQVRARNAAARNQYYNTVANIKNAALEAKNNASLVRSQAFSTSLSGLSQAWNNFWTAGRTAYEDDQARRAMIASSKDATPTRLIEMGYNLSPQVIASLYNTSTDQRTKNFYLSMLDNEQRRKYGIS